MSETKYFSKKVVLSANSEPAGVKFPATLAYRTFHRDHNAFSLNGDDATLSPTRFFIIVVGLVGGGESSSPSNQPAPFDGPRFPKTPYQDNIHLQYALCTEELGLSQLFAYIGYSMGGQQAYHMVTMYPDFVQAMVGLSTSARTSMSNWMSLEGPRNALIMARDFHDG